MGISNEIVTIEVVTIVRRRATIIAISIKFDNFSRVITAKKPVIKGVPNVQSFFCVFSRFCRRCGCAVSSFLQVALPGKTILDL